MPRVKVWETLTTSSGTSTVVDSATGNFPAVSGEGDTLLRTLAGVSVTAFAGSDPLTPFSAHSQLILALWQSVDTSPPGPDWPWEGSLDDSILVVPLMPAVATVLTNDPSAPTSYSVALHFGHSPTPAESRAQRLMTASFAPLYWYVGGAQDSPQSGLDMSYRIWVRQLWDRVV